MAKGNKALKRKKRDERQGKMALYIGVGITIALVLIIFLMSRGNF